jgi:hypothetical protein
MKNLLIISIVTLVCFTAQSQQLIGKSYQKIKDESIKYNSQVSAIYYQETPIVLMVSKNNDMLEYLQTFMFSNQQCISETQCYPSSLLESKYIYLTALYGEPKEKMHGDNKMYYWRVDGKRITLNLIYSSTHKKEVTQINYARDSDIDAIVDVTQKSQTPFTKLVNLKSE